MPAAHPMPAARPTPTAPENPRRIRRPAGGERRGVRLGLVVRVHPAREGQDLARDRIDTGLHELLVAHGVGLRVLGADERDHLLDLDVVQRTRRVPFIRPDRHLRIGVPAGIPPADRQDVVEVRLVEMLEQLVLAVEGRPDATFPVHAVAARAVGLVDVVAALDGQDLLRLSLRLQPRRGHAQRSAQLVEPVEGHEQHDDDHGQEADPTSVRRLAHDLRGTVGCQLELAGSRGRREALDRRRRRVGSRSGQPFLRTGLAGLVGHRGPRR